MTLDKRDNRNSPDYEIIIMAAQMSEATSTSLIMPSEAILYAPFAQTNQKLVSSSRRLPILFTGVSIILILVSLIAIFIKINVVKQ